MARVLMLLVFLCAVLSAGDASPEDVVRADEPDPIPELDGKAYFSGTRIGYGRELWSTDGTPAGTVLVKDIVTGATGSDPRRLTVMGGRLYFTANDGTNGRELWVSDGTADGTQVVKDIAAGANSSNPDHLFAVGSWLVFTAYVPGTGYTLWASDGTEAGTTQIADVEPANLADEYSYNWNGTWCVVGSSLYFNATNAANGSALWVTDGTSAGTRLVKNVTPDGVGSTPIAMATMGGKLYYVSRGDNSRLWVSDGTDAGTVQYTSAFYSCDFTTAINGLIYIRATTPMLNNGMWVTDGDPTHLTLLSTTLTAPSFFFGHGGMVYTDPEAPSPYQNRPLVATDGTEGGTAVLADVPFSLPHTVGSTLYFSSPINSADTRLWKSDGTVAGTVEATAKVYNPASVGHLGGTVLVSRKSDWKTYPRLWASSGSDDGTVRFFPQTTVVITTPTSDATWDTTLATPTISGTTTDDYGVGSVTWSLSGATTGSGTATGTSSWSFIPTFNIGVTMVTVTAHTTDANKATATLQVTRSAAPGPTITITQPTNAATWTATVPGVTIGGLATSSATITSVDYTLSGATTGSGTASGTETWAFTETFSPGLTTVTVTVHDSDAGTSQDSIGLTYVPTDFSPPDASYPNRPDPVPEMDGLAYFGGTASAYGRELWVTDGTPAGTVLVKDIRPGTTGSGARRLTVMGGKLYFSANDGTSGRELWVSDGTAAGTHLVKNIADGPNSSNPDHLFAVGSWLVFTAYVPGTGYTLWASDGTEAGTTQIADVDSANLSDEYSYNWNGTWCVVGSSLYFNATNAANGSALWVTDGTSAGTRLVKNVSPGGPGGVPVAMTTMGGKLYYTSVGDNSRLWVSDGTDAGTVQYTAAFHNCDFTTAIGGLIYVRATTNTLSNGMWVTDGDPSHLTLLSTDMTAPAFFVERGGTVYTNPDIAFPSPYQDRPLVETDGTPGGTGVLADVPFNLPYTVGSTLYFSSPIGSADAHLWKSDGTTMGTVKVTTRIRDPAAISQLGDMVLIGKRTEWTTYPRLWASDGTDGGTVRVFPRSTIAITAPTTSPTWSTTLVTPTISGTAADPYGISSVTWSLSGATTGSGTATGTSSWSFIPTLNVGVTTVTVTAHTTDANRVTATLTVTRTAVAAPLITITQPNNATTWTSTVAGVTIGGLATSSATITSVDYTMSGATTATGTATGTVTWEFTETFNPGVTTVTVTVHDSSAESSQDTIAITYVPTDFSPPDASYPNQPDPVPELGGFAYFAGTSAAYGRELWATDGSPEGSVLIKDIAAGMTGSAPKRLTVMGGKLYFSANDGANGRELWVSDGTASGTHLVKDIASGPSSANPDHLFAVGTRLVFTAYQPGIGYALWSTDGTEGGTTLIKDVRPTDHNDEYSYNWNGTWCVVGSTLFFNATNAANGSALWQTDGTAGGTALVKNVTPGGPGSTPVAMTTMGGKLYYTSRDADSRLWVSDGTDAGTVQYTAAFHSCDFTTAIGGLVYVRASTNTLNNGMWVTDGDPSHLTLLSTELTAPAFFVECGGVVYANPDAPASYQYRPLVGTDGTPGGTAVLADVSFNLPYTVGNTLYFSSPIDDAGAHLWKSDGTEGGTVEVTAKIPNAASVGQVGGKVLAARKPDWNAYQALWASSGTEEGTVQVFPRTTIAITAPTSGTTWSTTLTEFPIVGTAADPGGIASVTWELSGATTGTGTASGTTDWTFTPTLGIGVTTVTVIAHATNGTKELTTLSVTVSPPVVIVITQPTSDAAWLSTVGSIAISGTAAGGAAIDSVTYTLSGETTGAGTATGTTAWSFTPTLNPGLTIATVTAHDSTGATAQDAINIIHDANAPMITVDTPSSSGSYSTELTTLTIGGTASDDGGVANITYALSGATVASGTASGTTTWSFLSPTLNPGTTYVTITAYDIANRSTSASMTVIRTTSSGGGGGCGPGGISSALFLLLLLAFRHRR